MKSRDISRRHFLAAGAAAASFAAAPRNVWALGQPRDEAHGLVGLSPTDRNAASVAARVPLQEFSYGDVSLTSEAHNRQLQENIAVLMALSDDSLLKPLRKMSGQAAPGEELGGWYLYDPAFHGGSTEVGFAPACTFGQWVSALARAYACTGDERIREKVLRLNRAYARTISGEFYENNRFPAYCYDKIICGLMDSHGLANDPDAYKILQATTDTALPHLPGHAVEHGVPWRPGKSDLYTIDESYTLAENLFLAYQRGFGNRYRDLGAAYLDDAFFDPLAEGHSNFEDRHAYSHVNALCSAMQGYMTLGSEKHLRAARNGFEFLLAQSFATGGWGADETLRGPDSEAPYASLSQSHRSFETPCGSYAHFKLTRYLLRVSGDARYGDSMDRVMYNTVLGAKPLREDGSTFYYSDYNFNGRKEYSDRRWACCSGTLPQVAADYRINAYFRDERGVFVNLYLPSTLRWKISGAQASLKQQTEYPFESQVHFEVGLSRPEEFALHLRIPAWSQGAMIAVNGKKVADTVNPGTFATLQRVWKNGDRVDLEIPLKTRLEPFNPRHTDTVAVMRGPLVLFAVDGAKYAVRRDDLLNAKKLSAEKWEVRRADWTMSLLPFTSIKDERYSTYLKVIG
jgi:uncharacterized protein